MGGTLTFPFIPLIAPVHNIVGDNVVVHNIVGVRVSWPYDGERFQQNPPTRAREVPAPVMYHNSLVNTRTTCLRVSVTLRVRTSSGE